MINYAQINDENIVVGISSNPGIIDDLCMIDITDLDEKPKIGSIYDHKTNSFTTPTIEPIELQPTLEEMQAQTLINTELLVAMAEIGL